MYDGEERVKNWREWEIRRKELLSKLSEEDLNLYYEYLKEDNEDGSIHYYEKWVSIKSIEVFVLPFYIGHLACYESSYKQKIMELYLKFLILSNHRDFQIENYLERHLWKET